MFNTTRIGGCAEVYNLDARGQYPLAVDMNITVSVPASVGAALVPWGMTEQPSCPFAPLASSVHDQIEHGSPGSPDVQRIRFDLA
jgi:hypothetical protein